MSKILVLSGLSAKLNGAGTSSTAPQKCPHCLTSESTIQNRGEMSESTISDRLSAVTIARRKEDQVMLDAFTRGGSRFG